MTSMFSKIATATASGGGNYIKDGNYKLMVEQCLLAGRAQDKFVAEFRVMESASNGAADEQGRPVIPNAVGTSCSLVCELGKIDNPGPGNARAFIEGVLSGLGYTPDQITEQLMADICGPANPLRGVLVLDETVRGVNKGRVNPANAGKPITKNKWKPIAQTLDEVKTQRAFLDANGAIAATPSVAPAAAAAASTPMATPIAPAAAPAAARSNGLLAGLGIK